MFLHNRLVSFLGFAFFLGGGVGGWGWWCSVLMKGGLGTTEPVPIPNMRKSAAANLSTTGESDLLHFRIETGSVAPRAPIVNKKGPLTTEIVRST